MKKPIPIFTHMFTPAQVPSRDGLYLTFIDKNRGFVMRLWLYEAWRDPVSKAIEKNQALFWIGLASSWSADNLKDFWRIVTGEDKAECVAKAVHQTISDHDDRTSSEKLKLEKEIHYLQRINDALVQESVGLKPSSDVLYLHEKIRNLEEELKAVMPPPPRIGAAKGRYKTFFKWCPDDASVAPIE